MELSKRDRKAIGKAVKKIRTIYEIDIKSMAKDLGHSYDYQVQIETGNLIAGQDRIQKIIKHFKLSIDDFVKIANCQTLIDVFKFLQAMGRI